VSGTVSLVEGSYADAFVVGQPFSGSFVYDTDETNGAVSDGTYDWIEILGSTTVDICLLPGGECEPDEFSPADGDEWTLAVFSDPSWISDGSLIPDELPASFTTLVVGIEIDDAGEETGVVFATVDVFSTTAVPVVDPAGTAALAAILLTGALWLGRSRRREYQRAVGSVPG
jgi:hypothetical protein